MSDLNNSDRQRDRERDRQREREREKFKKCHYLKEGADLTFLFQSSINFQDLKKVPKTHYYGGSWKPSQPNLFFENLVSLNSGLRFLGHQLEEGCKGSN